MGIVKETLKFLPRFSDIMMNDHRLYIPSQDGKYGVELCNELDVEKTQVDIVSKEVTIYLKYWLHGNYHVLPIKRKDFIKAGLLAVLPARGIQITDSSAPSILNYLLLREQIAPVEYVHTHVGLVKIRDERVFLHSKAHSAKGDIQSTYIGNLKIKPKGTLEGELQLIREQVLGNTALECSWILGFSAAVISSLRGSLALDNIIVHSYGKSSTGKSTSSLLSIAPFGFPSKSDPNSLFASWMGTPNALVGRLSNNTGLPMVYDEASMQNPKIYAQILYQMSSGLEKSRLTPDSTLRDKGTWSTSIISNAENALLNQFNQNTGLRVRVLQFGNIHWTSSAENSTILTERLQDNFGNSGVAFVKHLLSYSEEQIIERFKEVKKYILDTMRLKDDFSTRSADKQACILLAAILVKEAFNLSIDLEGILEMLRSADEEQIQDRDIGRLAYLKIKEEIMVNVNHFIQPSNENVFQVGKTVVHAGTIPKIDIYGRLQFGDDASPCEAWILKGKLGMLLEGFTDIDVILHEWREKGIIECDTGKYTKKRALYKKGGQVRIVLIKLVGNQYELDDDQFDETALPKLIKKEVIMLKEDLLAEEF